MVTSPTITTRPTEDLAEQRHLGEPNKGDEDGHTFVADDVGVVHGIDHPVGCAGAGVYAPCRHTAPPALKVESSAVSRPLF
jgi:hypothetical protein